VAQAWSRKVRKGRISSFLGSIGHRNKVPKRAELRPIKTSTRTASSGWKIELPRTISSSGKRERYFFATRAEAEGFAQRQRKSLSLYGAQGGGILSPVVQEQANMAIEALKPFDVPLSRVVHDWISQRQTQQKSVTFEEAMEAFTASAQRSRSYLASLRQTRNRLQSLHGRLMCDITPDDVAAALGRMTDAVRNFTIRILGGVFMYSQRRGYCEQNPAKAVGTTPVLQSEIEVYSPEEALLILRTAEKHDRKLLPFLVVSLFCGIRRSEVLRLDWSTFQLEERFCRLPASITKKRRTRHIQLTDNCLEWLASLGPKEGRVVPFSDNVLRGRLDALQQIHGVRTIKHGFRHSFATYSLALHGDINRLTLELGHNNPSTTFRHYAKAATKKVAVEFFDIHRVPCY
jgi:integrase